VATGEMIREYILGLLFDTFELPPQQRIKVTSVCFLAKLIALYNATSMPCALYCSTAVLCYFGVSSSEIFHPFRLCLVREIKNFDVTSDASGCRNGFSDTNKNN